MTPRDVFALIVRTTGLLSAICCAFDLLHYVFVALGLPDPAQAGQAAVGAFEYGIVGLALLFGARPITRLIYGQGP